MRIAHRAQGPAGTTGRSALMAACVVVVLPSILFFCLIQQKIAGGLSEGAVK